MSDATQNGPVGDSSGREVKKVTRLPKCFALFSVTDKYVSMSYVLDLFLQIGKCWLYLLLLVLIVLFLETLSNRC